MEKWYSQEELYWLDDILPLRRRRHSMDIDDQSDDDIMMENGKVKAIDIVSSLQQVCLQVTTSSFYYT